MSPFTSWETVKNLWPAVLFIVLVVVVLAVGLFFRLKGCDDATSGGPDYLEDVRDNITEGVSEHRAENDARIEQLEAEVYELRLRVEELDAEVAQSVEQREEIHNALEQATTIDDIDRILRGGIPGISGRID